MAWLKVAFISDTHAPFEHPACMALLKEWLKREPQDLIVWGGDMLDCYLFSHFPKTAHRFNHIQDEVDYGRAFLKDLREACGKAKVKYLAGNHEYRMTSLLAMKAPELQLDDITIPKIYRLKELDVEYLDAVNGKSAVWEYAKHLTFMHGENASSAMSNTALTRTLFRWGDCSISAHAHRGGIQRIRFGCGTDIFSCISGCLCEAPSFQVMDTWTRGFVSLRIEPKSGQFSPPQDNVITGKHFTRLWTSNMGLEAFKHKDGSWRTRDL